MTLYPGALGFSVSYSPAEEGRGQRHASLTRGATTLVLERPGSFDATMGEPFGLGVMLYPTIGGGIDIWFEQAKACGATIEQESNDRFSGHRDATIVGPDQYPLFVSQEVRSPSAEEMPEQSLCLLAEKALPPATRQGPHPADFARRGAAFVLSWTGPSSCQATNSLPPARHGISFARIERAAGAVRIEPSPPRGDRHVHIGTVPQSLADNPCRA